MSPKSLDQLLSTFQVEQSIHVDVPIERVWALIVDVQRIVEFSPECVKVEWLGGATTSAVGARFAGTSRIGSFEWTRNCTITALEEPSVFAYEVYDEADEMPKSRWRFEVAPDGSGTIITHRFAYVPVGRSTIRSIAEIDPEAAEATLNERAETLTRDMRRTLEAMRAILEGSAPGRTDL